MTMGTESTRIVETTEEASAGEGIAIVVPTLRLDEKVRPITTELSALARRAESTAVWRPIHAFRSLSRHRVEFAALSARYGEAVDLCHVRMGDPVGGGSSSDNAWFQGFSTALGTSALLKLQFAYQSVGEVLDRKAAYALAAISLYVAILSMLLTVAFGWLSIPVALSAAATPNTAVKVDAPKAARPLP